MRSTPSGRSTRNCARRGAIASSSKLSDLSGRRIIRGGSMAKEDFIKKNPETVRRYVAAIAKAADWANTHGAEVVQIGIDHGHLDKDLAAYVYTLDGKGDFSVLKWSEHGLQNDADVAFLLDLVERQGIVPKGKHKVIRNRHRHRGWPSPYRACGRRRHPIIASRGHDQFWAAVAPSWRSARREFRRGVHQ
jgi:hypothetical protein